VQKGEIELSSATAAVDIIINSCVINLCMEKGEGHERGFGCSRSLADYASLNVSTTQRQGAAPGREVVRSVGRCISGAHWRRRVRNPCFHVVG